MLRLHILTPADYFKERKRMRQRAEMPVQREAPIALTANDMLKFSAYNHPSHMGAMGSPVYAHRPVSFLPQQRPNMPQTGVQPTHSLIHSLTHSLIGYKPLPIMYVRAHCIDIIEECIFIS